MLHPGKTLLKALINAAGAPLVTASSRECNPPMPGAHAGYIPNVLVHTHEGQVARFYEDLIRPRVVLINCISMRNDNSCGHMETMAQVQRLIGERLGREVFIYSITTDPEHDTVSVLRAAADKYSSGKGWLFLTGEAADLMVLRQRLFTHDGGQDCSMHLVRYGNEAAGVWGGVSAQASAESIAQRISWITPRERPSGPPLRGGPPPLALET